MVRARAVLDAWRLRRGKTRTSCRRAAAPLVAWLLLAAPGAAGAQGLDLALIPSVMTGAPGSTVTFSGRITNTTGGALNATDLFLNVSGYNPSVLPTFTQVLGLTSFVLPNNTFSAIVPLFDVAIAPTAPPGNFGFEVVLQDINNVASAPVTGTVTVTPSVIPEPSTLALLGGGLALVPPLVARRRRGRRAVP